MYLFFFLKKSFRKEEDIAEVSHAYMLLSHIIIIIL